MTFCHFSVSMHRFRWVVHFLNFPISVIPEHLILTQSTPPPAAMPGRAAGQGPIAKILVHDKFIRQTK